MNLATGRALALAVGLGLVTLLLAAVVSGSAAAAAANVSVSPSSVNSSATVVVIATAGTPGNDLTFVVDGDRDGTIRENELLETVTSNATTGDGSVSTSLGSYVSGEGTFTFYAVEESSGNGSDDTAYPVADPAAFFDANATVEVDDTAPTITNVSVANPSGRDVRVTFDASEPLAAIGATLDGPDGGTLTAVDFVASGAGPYAYEATYFPAADGEYALTLTTAADAAGNDGADGENGTVVAAVAARDADALFAVPSTVYLGEMGVDASPALGDGSVALRAVDGSGRLVRADASSLDVTEATGFDTGGYDADGDGTVELVVREPRIDDLSVVLTGGDDVDVGGAYLQSGDAVTVTASFGFGEADDLRLSVRDPAGLDVAPALTGTPLLRSRDDDVRLDTGGADLQPGEYTIRASAEALAANATTTVTLVDRALSVSLDRTRVVSGRAVTATAFGPPGARAVVRLPVAALSNGSTPADAVFEATGDVANRTAAGGYVGVELALGRDGIAQTRFDTAVLERGSARVSIVEGNGTHLGASATDAVPLDVAARTVVLREAPEAAAINEVAAVSGTAPQSESVTAYARVGETWYPVRGHDWARASVADDGSFELTVPVEGELAYPGVYQVAVVGLPDASGDDLAEDEPLTHGELTNRPSATFTLETRLGAG